jgi:hypothetical protein
MGEFSADWLSLREPFDAAARQSAAAALTVSERLAAWRHQTPDERLTVIDLGCGQGANLRALAPSLGGAQSWRLLDHDPALLAAIPQTLAQWARSQGFRFEREGDTTPAQALRIAGPDFHAHIELERIDLAQDLASLDFGVKPLVTACALLDLVSAPWLQMLIRKGQAAHAALMFSLVVDGRISWNPVDPQDALVQALFSQHQRRDKGFGPAMGAQAVASALQQLASAGYTTQQANTDWQIEGGLSPAMQLAMVQGLAAAALAQDASGKEAVLAWQARRSGGISSSRLRVGHVDIVATPAEGHVHRSRSHT